MPQDTAAAKYLHGYRHEKKGGNQIPPRSAACTNATPAEEGGAVGRLLRAVCSVPAPYCPSLGVLHLSVLSWV